MGTYPNGIDNIPRNEAINFIESKRTSLKWEKLQTRQRAKYS